VNINRIEYRSDDLFAQERCGRIWCWEGMTVDSDLQKTAGKKHKSEVHPWRSFLPHVPTLPFSSSEIIDKEKGKKSSKFQRSNILLPFYPLPIRTFGKRAWNRGLARLSLGLGEMQESSRAIQRLSLWVCNIQEIQGSICRWSMRKSKAQSNNHTVYSHLMEYNLESARGDQYTKWREVGEQWTGLQ